MSAGGQGERGGAWQRGPLPSFPPLKGRSSQPVLHPGPSPQGEDRAPGQVCSQPRCRLKPCPWLRFREPDPQWVSSCVLFPSQVGKETCHLPPMFLPARDRAGWAPASPGAGPLGFWGGAHLGSPPGILQKLLAEPPDRPAARWPTQPQHLPRPVPGHGPVSRNLRRDGGMAGPSPQHTGRNSP